MKRRAIILTCLVLFLFPCAVFAQEKFKAEVLSATEKEIQLKGLEGKWENQKIISDLSQYDITSMADYESGDKVIAEHSIDAQGKDVFYVLDYARSTSLYWLALVFALAVIIIGKMKGVRALIVLALTFIVILKFIIPKILEGHNPLLISIIGSLIILIVAIYVTEGVNRKSTIAIASVLLSLIVTGILAIWFTGFTKLSGFANEEAMLLVDIMGKTIDIKGILLAGIIIGALGVLDDVVISQVVLVKELNSTSPNLSPANLYKKAMKVGVSHLSSMVNTLFLAYAGTALPLLILFMANSESPIKAENALNNEMIATEIVRSLTGSIGLILAVPISTALAAFFYKTNKRAA